MTIHNELDHPRSSIGTFTNKEQGLPQVQLAHPELPVYDPTFFYERIGESKDIRQLDEASVPRVHLAPIRNAIQAVNDAFAFENEISGAPKAGEWVETKVYKDGDFLVADIQHKDQTEAPFGSLVVFSRTGDIVSTFDNHSDEFGPRWQQMGNLRSQLLADLSESSIDGTLGDDL